MDSIWGKGLRNLLKGLESVARTPTGNGGVSIGWIVRRWHQKLHFCLSQKRGRQDIKCSSLKEEHFITNGVGKLSGGFITMGQKSLANVVLPRRVEMSCLLRGPHHCQRQVVGFGPWVKILGEWTGLL